jgi:hypothetical protein
MEKRIPDGEAGLIDYGENINRCNGKYATVLSLKAEEITALEMMRNNFKTLHEQGANHDQPKTVTTAKNKVMKDYLKELRRFIEALQANPKMTDVIRADYNITIKAKPSKIGVPSGQVSLKLSYAGGLHNVEVAIEELVDNETPDRHADYGVTIYKGLMPAGGATLEQAASAKHYLMKPPVSGDELKYDRFTRKKKEIVVFDADEAGIPPTSAPATKTKKATQASGARLCALRRCRGNEQRKMRAEAA